MPVYRFYKKELLHIHIPKTGGTSVTKAVEKHGGLSSYMRKSPVAQCGNVPPQHMDIEHTKMFFDLEKIPAFAVVRDPWKRTVSEFVWQTRTINFQHLNSWLRSNLINVQHEKHANHFLPQHKFINKDVKLFRYDRDWNAMIDYVGKQLKIRNFDIEFREGQVNNYDAPKRRIVSKTTQSLWEDFYKEDLDLYHSL